MFATIYKDAHVMTWAAGLAAAAAVCAAGLGLASHTDTSTSDALTTSTSRPSASHARSIVSDTAAAMPYSYTPGTLGAMRAWAGPVAARLDTAVTTRKHETRTGDDAYLGALSAARDSARKLAGAATLAEALEARDELAVAVINAQRVGASM